MRKTLKGERRLLPPLFEVEGDREVFNFTWGEVIIVVLLLVVIALELFK